MKNRIFTGLIALAAIALISACGGKHKTDTSVALVRFVNATGVSGLSLTITNSAADSTAVTVASSVAAGSSSAYTSVATGTSSVVSSGGSLTASSSVSVSLSANYYYTFVAYQRNGAITIQAMSDGYSGQTTPSTGYSFLSIANPASDAGPLDVYVVQPNTTIDDTVTPKYSNVYAGGTSSVQSIATGTYDVVVTAYNRPADVRFKWSNIALTDKEVATLFLLNTTSGALVDGVLVQQDVSTTQGGAVTVRANSNARVRLVGAFSGLYRLDYATTGSFGDSVITNGIGANGYKLVSAGTSVQSVSVTASGGSTVAAVLSGAVTSKAFVSGSDYTILVYGDISAPSVKLIDDNNQAPTAARIRMINVVSWPGNDAFNVISLYNSSVSLFSQPVGYQEISTYAGLTTGVSHLNAQVEALTNPLVTIQDGKNIAYGGVYTLIMGGNNTALSYALILDRCLPNFTC
jgi:hypothetical protein